MVSEVFNSWSLDPYVSLWAFGEGKYHKYHRGRIWTSRGSQLIVTKKERGRKREREEREEISRILHRQALYFL